MSVDFTKKTWYDGSEGGTPITAAELNRVETGIDDVVTQSNADKTNIDNHTASKVNSSDGAHGLRYYNSELDYYDDTNEEWVEIQTGGGGTDVIVPTPVYGSTASKTYIEGDYIYSVRGTLGTDTLYEVTTSVERGDTWAIGTNIALSTDEGAEVFVANIISGEYGVLPYNIVGMVNSDGTVTRYGSSRDTSDIANRTLTNIQNTTTTDVECRYSNTGKEFIANDWNFVNGKYINIKSENNVIYAVVSEDGYTVTNKVATNLPSDIGYVFQNPNSNVYFAICVVSGAKVSIFYSSDLATWTKVILPNSEGTEPEQGIYRYKMNYVSKPISYTLWGNTCIVIGLGYRQYEDGEGIMQTDYTSIITARNGNDFAVANSNLGSFNENLDTSVFYQYYNTPNYQFVLSSYTSTDGLTYTKYTLPDDRSPQYVTKVEENYFIWGTDYTNHTCAVFSTSDFTTFTKVYDFYPSTWQEHPEFSDYFDEVNRVLFKNDTYFVLGSNYDSEHDTYKAAIVAIPSTFTNREWCDLPNGEYNFNPDRSKATVYDYRNGTEYNLLNISPFTAEVSKALTILDVGSGGGSGTDDYEDLLNKPSINGVELLGNKAIGTLSGDIQVGYADLLNKPSINGVELLGNKLVGLLSTDIHINADKIGYSGTVSGASTAKSAIDALQSSLSGLHGIPSGGNTNQVLAKNSSSDYDLKWVNQTGGGSGFKIIVTAPTYPNKSVTVTESDSGDTVTETTDANGVATFIVSAGTWTATTLVGGATVTLGSVTVGTTNIEYSGVKFAFHYSENDSSPNSVTYPSGYDNSDWSSDTAHMDFTHDTFHYGNWDPSGTNAARLSWLFPKPCMLKSDGTVDYYLNPNDYTKKADGTASDIANTSYDGNAMMEWGQNGAKIYWKIIPDSDNKGFTFCVANTKLDEDYDCWNHYDCDNNIKDHFYTPIYFGSLVNNKLRSLSGRNNLTGTTRQQEINYAKANNTDANKTHWYTEVYADWLLQSMLTTLITKSLDSQTKIGQGRSASGNSSAINTGTMNTKGLFWGSTNGTDGVKCWGMENTWGNLYRAIGGLIASTQTIKVKLTPNNHDGTTATSYNLDGTGYTTANTISGSTGYISHMYATKKSLTPATLSGSESTYYCDRCYTTTTANTYYAIVSGDWSSGATAGAFIVYLDVVASIADTYRGASLSYK